MVSFFTKSCLRLIVLVILFFSGVAMADDSGSLKIDLSGPWQIQLGDNRLWSGVNVDDAAWDELVLPGNVARYSIAKTGRFFGTAWLRKTVFIPENWSDRDIGVCLGQISHADETFFNGEKIGQEGDFPPKEMSMWNITRLYFIPKNLVRPGQENVIAIRVWYHTYGSISGKFYLSDYPSWKKERVWAIFYRMILNYVIIAMGIPLMVIFLLFYIQRPESGEYLFYFLQLLCGLFIILDLCSLWRIPGGIQTRLKLVSFSWLTLNIVHPIFLHRLYNLQRQQIEWYGIGSLFMMIPLFFFVKETQFRAYGLITVFVAGSVGFYNLSCHISALWLEKPYAKLFAFFGITVVLGAIHDGLVYMSKLIYADIAIFGYVLDYMVFPLSAFALFMGTAFILVYRFAGLLKVNEELNKNLENKIEDRTRSLILLTEELEKKNVHLEDMAIRDSLTGLYNHASFCERLDEIFMTSKKNYTPMAVAMIDVDDFKGFNDTYGHQVGDEVLIRIANVLKSGIREYDLQEKYQNNKMGDNRNYDLAGRYGGDEFMIVLPQCGRKAAIKVMERICASINQIRIDTLPEVRVSGSFGVAHYHPQVKCPSSDELIMLADLALYKSKSMGKNRVFLKIYESP